MKVSGNEENPNCPECGFSETKIHTQIVKTFSYKCPECGKKFSPDDV